MWYTITMPIRNPLDPNDPTDPRHGTLNGYTNHKCRCVPCLDFGRNYFKEKARERREKGLPAGSRLHGTEGGYSNYKCRCEPCMKARSDYAAIWRAEQKKKEETA